MTDGPAPERASVRWRLALVLLVALALRLAALVPALGAVPVLDEKDYLDRAGALLDGRGFEGSLQSVLHKGEPISALPQYPGAHQPPGYPTFLAAVLASSGRSLLAVKLVQVLLGTLSCALVFRLGRGWYGSPAGLLGAALFAVDPTLIAFTHYLWSETVFIFLLCVALAFLVPGERPPRLPRAPAFALGGLVLGIAALTRSAALALLPVLCGWLLRVHRAELRTCARRIALAALAMTVVIAPWTARNYHVLGGFVLIDTAGAYNFWRGNARGAFADRGISREETYAPPFDSIPLHPVVSQTKRDLVQEAVRRLGTPRPTDLEMVGLGRALAWEHIREDPAGFLRRARYKLVDMWNPTSFLLRHFRMRAYGDVSPAWEGHISWAAVMSYLLVVALAVPGALLTVRNPHTWLILGFVASFTAIHVVTFGLTRYRLPLMPFVGLLAACALPRLPFRRALRSAAPALLLGAPLIGCGPAPSARPPDILWIVWDTVRADHLGLYGHERPTTPFLERWAREALVFERAASAASHTVPSHASMFTGLLPSEHGASNVYPRLDDGYQTIAELLQQRGYRTFLYSANPHIGHEKNFAQGFDAVEHPWDSSHRERTLAVLREKLSPLDRSNRIADRLRRGEAVGAWGMKSAGAVAQEALLDWLERTDASKPFFVLLNYMEAHRPYVPGEGHRRRMMSSEEVQRSYRVDRSWAATFSYTFGLEEWTDEELALTAGTYDAALAELDDLLRELLASLEARGRLEHAVVVLTSDHGEHLGEHHLLDHQYSVYEPLIRVPLVLHAPGRVAPGREARPVSTIDLFPTLLELAGVEAPRAGAGRAVSLLRPLADRALLAEYPGPMESPFEAVAARHPGWEPGRWRRSLRAYLTGSSKWIEGSDGSRELYDLDADPEERIDLSRDRERADALASESAAFVAGLAAPLHEGIPERTPSAEERERLEALGYLAPREPDDPD